MSKEKTIDDKQKFQEIISFILVGIGVLGLSYMFVFRMSFMPYGYELVSAEESQATVVSYDYLAREQDRMTKEEDHVDFGEFVTNAIERLKVSYLILYTGVLMSTIIFVYEFKRKEKAFLKSILNSGILVSFLPLLSIYNSIDRIEWLMY